MPYNIVHLKEVVSNGPTTYPGIGHIGNTGSNILTCSATGMSMHFSKMVGYENGVWSFPPGVLQIGIPRLQRKFGEECACFIQDHQTAEVWSDSWVSLSSHEVKLQHRKLGYDSLKEDAIETGSVSTWLVLVQVFRFNIANLGIQVVWPVNPIATIVTNSPSCWRGHLQVLASDASLRSLLLKYAIRLSERLSLHTSPLVAGSELGGLVQLSMMVGYTLNSDARAILTEGRLQHKCSPNVNTVSIIKVPWVHLLREVGTFIRMSKFITDIAIAQCSSKRHRIRRSQNDVSHGQAQLVDDISHLGNL
ncbi:hypothetical protein EDD17DRAFT_1514314 [Pisolithus thermaeus]|nr:hypothetical protein EV401DRAFT_2159366 [Pisolithus croceorrhizus]KAI6148170.1 hypothetical protein EDD17DRAFT_1514314 [Pisolithus thermaeus]